MDFVTCTDILLLVLGGALLLSARSRQPEALGLLSFSVTPVGFLRANKLSQNLKGPFQTEIADCKESIKRRRRLRDVKQYGRILLKRLSESFGPQPMARIRSTDVSAKKSGLPIQIQLL